MRGHREERKHGRRRHMMPVTFVPDSALAIKCECDSRDISEGGIRVLSSREPISGSGADISFRLPGRGRKLTLHAKVVWSRPSKDRAGWYEMGIAFMPMSPASKRLLRSYVYGH